MIMKKHKLKRKSEMEMSTFVGIIIFVVLFLTVILPVGIALYRFYFDKSAQTTIKSMNFLIVEADNLIGERTVPIFVEDGYIIHVYPAAAPDKACADKSCLCVCVKEGCDVERGNVVQCKPLEVKLQSEYVITPFEDSKKKTVIGNCRIALVSGSDKNKAVSISCTAVDGASGSQ